MAHRERHSAERSAAPAPHASVDDPHETAHNAPNTAGAQRGTNVQRAKWRLRSSAHAAAVHCGSAGA